MFKSLCVIMISWFKTKFSVVRNNQNFDDEEISMSSEYLCEEEKRKRSDDLII